MRTNVLVCLTIVGGFVVTSALSYQANYGASLQNIEQVSRLASGSMYHQLNTTFSKPLNVSLTMANDSLLKLLLSEERDREDDPSYDETIRTYLGEYHELYGYESVFLVSADTGRYYSYTGSDRTMNPEDPANDWYYDLLKSGEAYAANVDNDDAANGEVTLFANCVIRDAQGNALGVVGVGMRIEHLQSLFRQYHDDFGVDAYLVDAAGTVEVSANHDVGENLNYFDVHPFTEEQKTELTNWDSATESLGFWAGESSGVIPVESDYVVARFLPDAGWHLVVERDTSELLTDLRLQLAETLAVIVLIVGVILFVITSVIRNFNRKIVNLTQSIERERRPAFEKATQHLFEDIYELDVTNDRPANEAAEDYFESLGAPRGASFSEGLAIIAEKQIKEEFRDGYLNTFSPDKVLEAYEAGREELRYECMISSGGEYYWLRITGRIVKNDEDGAVHMLVYRQNVNAEKLREGHMRRLAMTDEMTGLYTKSATERVIGQALEEDRAGLFAFFIFDIDVFKQANDRFGHAFGDTVIKSFTGSIRSAFRKDDVIGRIGGDEFVAFASVPDEAWARRKAEELSRELDRDHVSNGKTWHMSASIGIAFAPRDGLDFDTLYKHADQALYRTKEKGRNGLTVYGED